MVPVSDKTTHLEKTIPTMYNTMDLDPTPPFRTSVKWRLPAHSGKTPMAKRQQIQVKATPESELDDDATESPTKVATLRKKASTSSVKNPSQRASSSFVPHPLLPPKFNAHA